MNHPYATLTSLALVALSFTFALGAAPACSSSSTPAAQASLDAAAPAANGQLGAWQTLAPLPVPRANHCSVVAGGYLVVIGGNYEPAGASSFQSTDEVDVAKIADDGSLGPWKKAGTTPAPVNSCTAIADGATIVLLDGIYDAPQSGTSPYEGVPQLATIGADGALSAFTPSAALPSGVRVLYSTGLASGGTLMTMFARLSADGDDVSMLTAPLSTSGALGAWSEQRWLSGFRGHPAYAFAPPFLYALGGYDATDAGNAVLASGEGAALSATGAAGAPFALAPLPSPTAFGAAVAVDRFVFVLGGKSDVFAGKGSATVLAGALDSAGAIASWTKLPDMPAGRTSLSVALGPRMLYVTGGGYDAGGLDTVFAAQVRF